MVENNGQETFTQSFPQYKEGGEQIQPIIEKTGILSKKSKIKIPGVGGNTQGEPRTLALRRTRRELMDEVRATPVKLSEEQAQRIKALKHSIEANAKEEIAKIMAEKNEPRTHIIEKGHVRDLLAQESLVNQREIRVDLGELGEQAAHFLVLPSPDQEKARLKPPVFLIPGISNEVENMGMLLQEAAMKGRNAIFIDYPEGWKGDVTEAFGKAAEQSADYEPHTAFFKKAIETIKNDQQVKGKIGDFESFDLWGYSAGSVITAEILTDPEFRKQVANAALICPPNCVDQKLKEISLFGKTIRTIPFRAIMYEQWNTLRPGSIKDSPKRNVTNRHNVISNSAMRARKVRAYDALAKKVTRKDEWWNRDMQVKDGGKITVVSYSQDKMTQSYKAVPEIKQNPKLEVVELSGSHQTCLIKPEPLIAAIA